MKSVLEELQLIIKTLMAWQIWAAYAGFLLLVVVLRGIAAPPRKKRKLKPKLQDTELGEQPAEEKPTVKVKKSKTLSLKQKAKEEDEDEENEEYI